LKSFVPAPGARVRVVFADDVAEAAEAATAAKTAAAEKPAEVLSSRKRKTRAAGRVVGADKALSPAAASQIESAAE
jgi:hypothetical protein